MFANPVNHNLDRVAALAAGIAFPNKDMVLIGTRRFPTMSSVVYRLTFKSGKDQETLFVKLPADDSDNERQIARLRREFDVTMRVRSLLVQDDVLHMVSPVGYIDEVNAIVTREAEGQPLLRLVQSRLRFHKQSGIDRLIRFSRLSGRWLQRFHALNLKDTDAGLYSHLQQYCDYRLDQLAGHPGSGIRVEDAARMSERISKWICDVRDVPVPRILLCHNDYSPHNILVGDSGIHVLDFSFATPGLPEFDQLCFWHKIEELKNSPFYANTAIEAVQEAFLSGYGSPIDFTSAAVKLGLARLVLSKMLTALKSPSLRPDRWVESRLRLNAYRRQILDGFERPLHT